MFFDFHSFRFWSNFEVEELALEHDPTPSSGEVIISRRKKIRIIANAIGLEEILRSYSRML
jgi:hypothetical protein